MKAMLSQPMAGKTEEEIKATREKAIKALEEMGYEVVNTLFSDEWDAQEKLKERGVTKEPVYFLAKALDAMSKCDAVYFCKGWEEARGCQIEQAAAKKYGLTILYEDAPIDTEEEGRTPFLKDADKAKIRDAVNKLLSVADQKGRGIMIYGTILNGGNIPTMELCMGKMEPCEALAVADIWKKQIFKRMVKHILQQMLEDD